jgi:hypothetical protein
MAVIHALIICLDRLRPLLFLLALGGWVRRRNR